MRFAAVHEPCDPHRVTSYLGLQRELASILRHQMVRLAIFSAVQGILMATAAR